MRKLHLLSNAHLDPVWQWEWEEGAAAAVSTFRAAADFCEEYDGYIFNHNEVILYKWIEEYEPALFERIRRLVAAGKWHIMGGWYLQPDGNMPAGESMVRQVLTGRTYFKSKFGGKAPTVAINFDTFGHSRGMVQILRKTGYGSYIFGRPDVAGGKPFGPAQDFVWRGFDGSEVTAHQIVEWYNSQLGEAHIKIERWLEERPDARLGLLLWGVGNHGGGPSRLDLERIAELTERQRELGTELVHSTPEAYFAELREGVARGELAALPVHADDLNPRFVGCYTSMIRIKQKHRRLENELYQTEKMLSSAALNGLLAGAYPQAELLAATEDLLMSEFHDILPGSSVQPAEEASLRLLDHGLEIVSRLKARAFFALAAGQAQAREGEYPILVYNPHPWPVRGVFACEFMLADQNWKDEYSQPTVWRDGQRIAAQAEKEQSNLNLDWRKRVVFEAELAPSSMNRFDCRIETLPRKPALPMPDSADGIAFDNGELKARISLRTGLLESYVVGGVPQLRAGAFELLVLDDNEDPWRMDTNRFGPVLGGFRLMSPGAGTDFSGVKKALLPSVRIVEDGDVRTVVEALFEYGRSAAVVTYRLPKRGTALEVEVRLYWNEKDKLVKLNVPTMLGTARGERDGRGAAGDAWDGRGAGGAANGERGGRGVGDSADGEASYVGQTIFGIQELPVDGTEAVAQKWTALVDRAGNRAVTLVNDGVYGSDCTEGCIRPTLLRSPGYCAHPIGERPIMPQDRFLPRIDQGERLYTFWLDAGAADERLAAVSREATTLNERPYALSFFPHGGGRLPQRAVELDGDAAVELCAFKQAEDGAGYILRLFEPTGAPRRVTVRVPAAGASAELSFGGFEVKTLRLDPQSGALTECAMDESALDEDASDERAI